MITNTGYYFKNDVDWAETFRPLMVTSCGNYRLAATEKMKTSRPNGRLDYQLLYLVSGEASFWQNGSMLKISPGHMFLYRCGEFQRYYFGGGEATEIFWLHFTGKDVSSFIENSNLFCDSSIYPAGIHTEYSMLFRRIIQELQLHRPCCEQFLAHYLEEIFLYMKRKRAVTDANTGAVPEMVEHAIRFFHEHFSQPVNIHDVAADLHVSICWFIRCFKKHTGLSPIQYLTAIRMANAQSFLMNSEASVEEVATLCGYENPLYFSRMFHKRIGMSPTAFRQGNV